MNGDTAAPGGRIMAFDIGQKRIGVALSDEGALLAQPLDTIEATSRRQAMELIMALVQRHRPVELVVGHPLNMDGTTGPQARRCEQFAGALAGASGLSVSLWDERLTTSWAERSLIEQDLSRRRRREVVDRVAAAILLQGYLDRRRSGAP